MKSISLYAVVAASACSALLISSAEAGGRRAGLGMSSSAGASMNSTSVGRSALGEPVFLIPSSSSAGKSFINNGNSGGPIGGYVAPRTPLPPLTAPPSTSATAALGSPSSTGTGRGTNVIFTPPPTFVGLPPSVSPTGNPAGNNVAERAFGSEGGGILSTGLRSKAFVTLAQPQVSSASAFTSSVGSSSSTDHAGTTSVSTAASAPSTRAVQSPAASAFTPSVGSSSSTDHAGTTTASTATSAPAGPTVQLGSTSSQSIVNRSSEGGGRQIEPLSNR